MTGEVKNKRSERLDYLVEGRSGAAETIVFVHGLGTNKDESFNYFADLSRFLKSGFRVFRFDFSGCGRSEGNPLQSDFKKWAADLKAVLDFVRKAYPGPINILAHSMGCFATLSLAPAGITKAVFTGIPNANTRFIYERLAERIKSRPASHFDPSGVTTYPRTWGEVQKFGPSFWRVLLKFDPLKAVEEFSRKTKLYLIHFNQDDVVGTQFLKDYGGVFGVRSLWLDGDHSLTNPRQRLILMKRVREFLVSA